jgi:hypothetical protein
MLSHLHLGLAGGWRIASRYGLHSYDVKRAQPTASAESRRQVSCG